MLPCISYIVDLCALHISLELGGDVYIFNSFRKSAAERLGTVACDPLYLRWETTALKLSLKFKISKFFKI